MAEFGTEGARKKQLIGGEGGGEEEATCTEAATATRLPASAPVGLTEDAWQTRAIFSDFSMDSGSFSGHGSCVLRPYDNVWSRYATLRVMTTTKHTQKKDILADPMGNLVTFPVFTCRRVMEVRVVNSASKAAVFELRPMS
jgi:hypothetical protein